MRQSIEFKVENRIMEHGRGWCFALKNRGKDHIDHMVRTQVTKFFKESNEKEIRQNSLQIQFSQRF